MRHQWYVGFVALLFATGATVVLAQDKRGVTQHEVY